MRPNLTFLCVSAGSLAENDIQQVFGWGLLF